MHTDNFNGAIDRYPFAYERLDVSQVRQVVNGEDYPYRALELSTAAGQLGSTDLEGYERLMTAMSMGKEQFTPMVRSSDWGEGKTCTVFLYNNVPGDNPNDGKHRNPPQTENVRLQLDFAAATTHNITVIVWSQHENVFEVNDLGGVKYNINH